jgi:hypothetical protein
VLSQKEEEEGMNRREFIALSGAALSAPSWILADEDEGFVPLYNGKDLSGWHAKGGKVESWKADGELLACIAAGGGWLTTDKEYADFILKLDWRIPAGGNSGVGIRYPEKGDPAHEGMEIQILDDDAPQYKNLVPAQYTGGIYYQVAPNKEKKKLNPPGQWNSYEIVCKGPLVVVKLNGVEITRANMDEETEGKGGHKPLSQRPRRGFIGLQSHGSRVDFRNIKIKVME